MPGPAGKWVGWPEGVLLPQLPGWAVLGPESHPWGGGQKRRSGPLHPGSPTHPLCGGFWNVLELAPFGDSFPKTWATTTPSRGAGKLQATTVCSIRMGCLYRPWAPQSTSEHLGTG